MKDSKAPNAVKKFLTIAEMVERAPAELGLAVVEADETALSRRIVSDRIQKMGLAFSGFQKYLHPERLKIAGQSEAAFLSELTEDELKAAIGRLEPDVISSILMTHGLEPSDLFRAFARKNSLPILRTEQPSSKAIALVTKFLQYELAPTLTLHGVLIEMYGIGVLLQGRSGVGKSECALDLISRGHSLISDDAVLIKRLGDRLVGQAPSLTYEHLEIHGLGIMNVRDLFGISAVSPTIEIDLCIELDRWDKTTHIERVGLDMKTQEIFGVSVPKYVLPVSSGRNLAILVETAVRLYILRTQGIDAAQRLVERHDKVLRESG